MSRWRKARLEGRFRPLRASRVERSTDASAYCHFSPFDIAASMMKVEQVTRTNLGIWKARSAF